MSSPLETPASPSHSASMTVPTANEAGGGDQTPLPPAGPPATPTTVLSDAFAASGLQSQGQTPLEPQNQEREPASPSPSSEGKHAGEAEAEEGDGAHAGSRDRSPATKKRKSQGGWTGKLSDQIPAFDSRTQVIDPVKKFEKDNKGLIDLIMTEFHLVLLEMHVWSTHRVESLKRKRQQEIKQGLDDIKKEEERQEKARLDLLSFMEQIQTAVEGISGMETLSS